MRNPYSPTLVVCPRCGAEYDEPTWHSLALLDRVESGGVGWIELRRCESCEDTVAAAAEDGKSGELFSTAAAARYCGLSVSGLRQAVRRGEIRPWTSSGLKLLWRRSDLETLRQTRLRRRLANSSDSGCRTGTG
jgi:Helix-turn-helix domain